MKKLLVIVLVVAMMLVMATSALAAPPELPGPAGNACAGLTNAFVKSGNSVIFDGPWTWAGCGG
jgi:hypothetical protein